MAHSKLNFPAHDSLNFEFSGARFIPCIIDVGIAQSCIATVCGKSELLGCLPLSFQNRATQARQPLSISSLFYERPERLGGKLTTVLG